MSLLRLQKSSFHNFIPHALIIYLTVFSHNILGRTTETLEAIDSTRNSEHYVIPYNSICYHRRVEGYDVERNELSEAILAVQENIKDKMKTEGKPAKNFIETMCFQDWKIKSLSEKLVNKVCTSETDKSKVVQDLVNETCGLAYVE